MPRTQRRKVAVFLGAGVSVQFGVPDAGGLLDGYIESSGTDEAKYSLVTGLIKTMRKCGANVTLENLLMLMDAWSKPDEAVGRIRPFLPLIMRKASIALVARQECGEAAKDVRDYVFRRCFINRSESIQDAIVFYDKLLRGLKAYFSIESLRPADRKYPYPNVPIFTTNFDNGVEIFCRKQRVHISDGYSKAPNGGYVFDQNEYDETLNPNFLRLYKIHGTVKYVKNSAGEFDEINYLLPGNPIIINDEECFPDLIFSESYQYTSNSPQLELLYSMKQQLRFSDRIVVIGYSFNDPHVLTVFREVLQENSGLRLILFSRRRPDLIIKKRFPSMRDRCICIQRDAKLIDIEADLRGMEVPR